MHLRFYEIFLWNALELHNVTCEKGKEEQKEPSILDVGIFKGRWGQKFAKFADG